MEIVVASVLSCWLLVSIVYQPSPRLFGPLGPSMVRIAALDLPGLIPTYTFFAPNPATTDYHLLFRDRLVNGGTSPWREAAIAQRGGLTRIVWNPHKRTTKALIDIISALVTLPPELDRAAIKLTVPYIALATHVAALPHSPISCARQFMVMETYGFYTDQGARVLVLSEFHALEEAQTLMAQERSQSVVQ